MIKAFFLNIYKPFAKQDQSTQSTVNVLITFVVSTGENQKCKNFKALNPYIVNRK